MLNSFCLRMSEKDNYTHFYTDYRHTKRLHFSHTKTQTFDDIEINTATKRDDRKMKRLLRYVKNFWNI